MLAATPENHGNLPISDYLPMLDLDIVEYLDYRVNDYPDLLSKSVIDTYTYEAYSCCSECEATLHPSKAVFTLIGLTLSALEEATDHKVNIVA